MKKSAGTKEELLEEISALKKKIRKLEKSESLQKQVEKELREAQEKLLESDKKYRVLVEAAMESIFIAQDGMFKFINQSFVDFSGYKLEELANLPFPDFIHPDDRQMVVERYFQRLEGKDVPQRYAFRFIDASGKIRWADISISLISWEGKPASLCFASDITERKQAEENLQENEKRLQKQNDSLLALMSRGTLFHSDLRKAIAEITEASAALIGTERVSVWLYNDDHSEISCLDLYRQSDHNHSSGETLRSKEFPAYTASHQKGNVIAAVDVYTDPRTSDIPASYYQEHGICSLLDAPVWIGDRLGALLSFEHVGNQRIWTSEDAILATNMAALLSIFFANNERKRAEAAMKESEERYRSIFENAAEGIYQSSPDGRLININPAMACMCGYSSPEDMKAAISDITTQYYVNPEDRERYKKLLADHGHVDCIEYQVYRKDGSRILISTSAREVRDSLGNLVCYEGIIQDITDRKRVEEALRETNENLRRSQEIAHVGNWRLDLASGRFSSSTEALALLGFPPDAAPVFEEVAGLIHENDRALAHEALQNLVRTGDPYSLDIRFRRRDTGEVISVISMGELQRDEFGRPAAVFGINQDITERKRAEEAMIASEEKFRKAFFTSPDSVNINRVEDGMYVAINPGFTRITGYEESEIIGKTSVEYNVWHNIEDRQRLVEGLKRDGQVNNIEAVFRMKSGELRDGLMSATVISLDGTPHILSITRDITSRKRAEEEKEKLQEQLTQAQKMESVGRLAGGVAHDFNNMLGAILGYAELCLNKTEPSDPLFGHLQQIQKAAERSAALTRQLLAFARKQTVAPIVLDLNETVEGMLKMIRRLVGEDIDLAWLPGGNLGRIFIDSSQVDQILANLCVNARDAITDTGKITIETDNIVFDEKYCALHAGFVPGEYILLAVSDDGSGMDTETIGHLFEPFFTTKETGKGTGLGLATVYGIVKQNNGFIKVYSEPGHGTTFKIYLPQHASKAAPQTEKEQAASPTAGRGTILLVEDEPSILEMATLMLDGMGYAVIAAGTPGKAIRLAREHRGHIDLLMTDVVMPEMNGRDLAKNILSLYPGVKCLFMSGYTANVIAHHGVLEQGVHFIQKPFSMKDLGAKVRKALENG